MASSKTSGAKNSTSGSKPAAAKPAGAKSTEFSHRSSMTDSKEAVRRARRTPQQVTESKIQEVLNRPGGEELMLVAAAKELLNRPDGDKTLLDFAAKEVLNRPNGGTVLARLALKHTKDFTDILGDILNMLYETPEGQARIHELFIKAKWEVELGIIDKDLELIHQIDEYVKLNSKTMEDEIEELRSLKQSLDEQAAVNEARAASLDEYEQELDGRAEAKRQREAETAKAKRWRDAQIEIGKSVEAQLIPAHILDDEDSRIKWALLHLEADDRSDSVPASKQQTPEPNPFTERIQSLVSTIRFRRATS